jgi:hypothetical protein
VASSQQSPSQLVQPSPSRSRQAVVEVVVLVEVLVEEVVELLVDEEAVVEVLVLDVVLTDVLVLDVVVVDSLVVLVVDVLVVVVVGSSQVQASEHGAPFSQAWPVSHASPPAASSWPSPQVERVAEKAFAFCLRAFSFATTRSHSGASTFATKASFVRVPHAVHFALIRVKFFVAFTPERMALPQPSSEIWPASS